MRAFFGLITVDFSADYEPTFFFIGEYDQISRGLHPDCGSFFCRWARSPLEMNMLIPDAIQHNHSQLQMNTRRLRGEIRI